MIDKSKYFALAITCGAKIGRKDSDLEFSPASLKDFLDAIYENVLDDAKKYKWLCENNKSFSWNPYLYSKDKVTGFAAFGNGYLGYSFDESVKEAIKNNM